MKVPIESMLRDPSRKDELEIFDKQTPEEIKEKAELEVVVVAGLVFYLDHKKKIVEKFTPKSNAPKQDQRLKSPKRKWSISS